jgi:hypothetical protein
MKEHFCSVEKAWIAYEDKCNWCDESEGRMSEIKVGDVVQVSPDYEMFGACMVVVTEIKSWGIQGYVQSAGVEGQQYIRLANDDFESTGGKAVWVVGRSE